MATTALASHESRFSQTERWLISDQLGRILISPWFRTSSRCSQLLRHSVELSIHGQTDRLKERQIAIEAFHRKASYDNNSDPVVRVAAGEVRKRLALYYGASENSGQIRIELPIGSYVPAFHFPDSQEAPSRIAQSTPHPREEPRSDADASHVSNNTNHIFGFHRVGIRGIAFGFAAVIILVASGVGLWRDFRPLLRPSGLNDFWAPVFKSGKTPLISVGELRTRELTFVPDPQRNHRSDGFTIDSEKGVPVGIPVERVDYSLAAARVAGVFGANAKNFDILDQSDTTFADFSGRPTILIGSYDNDWSMGITEGKPFQFKLDSARGMKWIADDNRPGEEIGSLQASSLEPATYDAFSIVMRQTGQISQQPRIVLAGITDKGTIAAAEFVSNPKYLEDFERHAPKDWSKKNVEFLLQTRVIEGVIGIPTIVDYKVW